jgi:hypothetical protein
MLKTWTLKHFDPELSQIINTAALTILTCGHRWSKTTYLNWRKGYVNKTPWFQKTYQTISSTLQLRRPSHPRKVHVPETLQFLETSRPLCDFSVRWRGIHSQLAEALVLTWKQQILTHHPRHNLLFQVVAVLLDFRQNGRDVHRRQRFEILPELRRFV